MRERSEIARRADRTLRRNARRDTGVQQSDQSLDQLEPNARMAADERRDLLRDGHAHDGIVQQRTGAGGMRQDQRALQLRKPGSVDTRPGKRSKAGVHAVNDAVLRQYTAD